MADLLEIVCACAKSALCAKSPEPPPLNAHIALNAHAHRDYSEPRRAWTVTTPTGEMWSVTCCPPVAHAFLAATWPPGSVLAPVPVAPMPSDSPALPDATEARIQRWLASIGEQDQAIIGEVLDLCADDPAILAMYLGLADQEPDELPSRNDIPDVPTQTCPVRFKSESTALPQLPELLP